MGDFVVFTVLKMTATSLWTNIFVCRFYILEGFQKIAGHIPEQLYLT